jgi:hypothetical protein
MSEVSKLKFINGAVYDLRDNSAVEDITENNGIITIRHRDGTTSTIGNGVIRVSPGIGLAGNPITSSGSLKVKIKDETKSAFDSNNVTNVSGRQYAVVQDKSGFLSVNVPWEDNASKTYTLSQDNNDGHRVILTASDGGFTEVIIPDNDTKNTAGATDTNEKIYLIGSTEQSTNPQTFSHDSVFVDSSGLLYSGGRRVLTSHQDISGLATLESPIFTGSPTAPTPSPGNNSTLLATTEFVMGAFENKSAVML